jgi:hypothetical protein
VNKLISLLLFFIISNSIALKAQERDGIYDSLAISFLREVYPHENIGFRSDTMKGIKKTVRNFYAYRSFHLTIKDSLTIEMVNLGAYLSEGGWYIAIIDSSKERKTYLYLGKKNLEDDLERLRRYFESKRGILKKEYKLEILDLFLRCENGQIETPVYIH